MLSTMARRSTAMSSDLRTAMSPVTLLWVGRVTVR